jgi:hypothetical protein
VATRIEDLKLPETRRMATRHISELADLEQLLIAEESERGLRHRREQSAHEASFVEREKIFDAQCSAKSRALDGREQQLARLQADIDRQKAELEAARAEHARRVFNLREAMA